MDINRDNTKEKCKDKVKVKNILRPKMRSKTLQVNDKAKTQVKDKAKTNDKVNSRTTSKVRREGHVHEQRQGHRQEQGHDKGHLRSIKIAPFDRIHGDFLLVGLVSISCTIFQSFDVE